MKISHSCYALEPHRKGAIIKVEEGGRVGYADLHPWPELGDKPLENHLTHQNTPLWERAIYFARIDAQGREKKTNLLRGISIPKSHFLVLDLDTFTDAPGFEVLKIKMGHDSLYEIEQLMSLEPLFHKRGFKLRLDFNNRLSEDEFNRFMDYTRPVHQFIDYIEDPFSYNETSWKVAIEKWKCPLALDDKSERGIGNKESAPVLILKPARQDEKLFHQALKMGQRVVVTSSLDHPLGQVAAAWTASYFPPEVGGLLSHKVYPTSVFSSAIDKEGPEFKIPLGTGFGFDEALQQMEWTSG